MTALPQDVVADLKRRIAELERETARLSEETHEARERDSATAAIVAVINGARGNLAPVFDCILEKAHHLCGAPCGSLQLYENDRVVPVAMRGMTEAFTAHLKAGYHITDRTRDRLFADRPLQIIDMAEASRSHPD